MTLAAQVVQAARKAGARISTAESCTGGMLGAALTDISGASAVFDRGFITYSYESKPELLGVAPEIVATHGAVSSEAAAAMARGALARSRADIAIAVTGIAGPVADTQKPEGRVWFAVARASGCACSVCEFGAIGRAQVRKASVDEALRLLLAAI